MDVVLKYRGRMIRESDLRMIRALIAENPTASRRELSRKLCEVWKWAQANGECSVLRMVGINLAGQALNQFMLACSTPAE